MFGECLECHKLFLRHGKALLEFNERIYKRYISYTERYFIISCSQHGSVECDIALYPIYKDISLINNI